MAFVLSTLMLATVAQAATITTFTTRAAFDAAAGTTTLETFNSYLTDVSFATTAVDVGAFTLSSTPGVNVDNLNKIDAPPISPKVTVNGTAFAGASLDPGMSVFFTFHSPITAFGLSFTDLSAGSTKVVVGADILSVTTPSSIGQFFGMVSDTPFTVIEIRAAALDGFGMDNVAFSSAAASAVPEPTSIALLASGLTGVLLRRRRQA